MKLRRIFFSVAVLATVLFGLSRTATAQISDQYNLSIQPRFYNPLTGGTSIPPIQFFNTFSPSLVDSNDGVAGPINIGFPVEYNGQTYTQMYVCINGWASFQNPGGYLTYIPSFLFNQQRPNLTLAPFFGDHFLRKARLAAPPLPSIPPSIIQYVTKLGARVGGVQQAPDTFMVEWKDLNINYFFDPLDPDNEFSPFRSAQLTSIGTFQLIIIQAPVFPVASPSRQPDIEFQYGPIGNSAIVKVSQATVGIEDEPAVPGGNTTFLNAIAYKETGRLDSTIRSTRVTNIWPPTGFPGRAFVFSGNRNLVKDGWGDGDADLTQINLNVPQLIRDDQRRFVTFMDVIRILRHTASRTNVDFKYGYGLNGFHGDVNHNGRFYIRPNWNNTADSVVKYPIKSLNYLLPLPGDAFFSNFLFEADEVDASLIMLYLAAKLPQLPWLPDTLPAFTGKLTPGAIANDIRFGSARVVAGNRVEIPVTLNGYLTNGSTGVRLDATNGTRIIEVRPMQKTDSKWVEAVAGDDRMALAAAGTFSPEDVIATLVVETNAAGNIDFENVRVSEKDLGARKISVFGGKVTGDNALSLMQNMPNPFNAGLKTTMAYSIASDAMVTVRVYDILGHEVRTLASADMKAGSYTAEWDGRDAAGNTVAAGVYYCRMETAGQSRTITMQVTR